LLIWTRGDSAGITLLAARSAEYRPNVQSRSVIEC
jgi:hypothetical protein